MTHNRKMNNDDVAHIIMECYACIKKNKIKFAKN